ncbi:very short patch repair endonuclease [Mesorhizobium sp. M0802]
MSRIRGKDTRPELAVRRYLHNRGLRYRLHDKRLPGMPDIVFSPRRVAVFVHGCFWHGHVDCRRATLPTTNQEFWKHKIQANATRDANAREELEKAGWTVHTVWQCEIDAARLERLFLNICNRPRNPSLAPLKID